MKIKLVNKRNVYRNKTIRRHKCDIFNSLSASLKLNRVTKKVYFEYCRRLKKITRSWIKSKHAYLHNKAIHTLSQWARNLPRTPLKLLPKGRKSKGKSSLGFALKRRRRLAIYLNGGRVRRHQYRAISKKGRIFSTIIKGEDTKQNRTFLLNQRNTSNMGVESRMDSLLVRSHFCKSVFQAGSG
jgi:ribosomal protein S4